MVDEDIIEEKVDFTVSEIRHMMRHIGKVVELEDMMPARLLSPAKVRPLTATGMAWNDALIHLPKAKVPGYYRVGFGVAADGSINGNLGKRGIVSAVFVASDFSELDRERVGNVSSYEEDIIFTHLVRLYQFDDSPTKES